MINPEKLNFKHLIMTIGNLPSSYVESLSYYECLLWLCNYLENTVIPAVNNNASALEELQGLFVELKSYVENYFDNLDVQEEINNKLEDMAQSGELTTLISEYINPLITAQNEVINEFKNEVNDDITDFKSDVNSDINEVQRQINALGNGSPLVASSTSEMTDTTKVYVNTTNGKWYYYDGDSWEIGGTYQTTGIGDNEILYNMLEKPLQDKIKPASLSQTVEYTTSGYYLYGNIGSAVQSLASSNYTGGELEVNGGDVLYNNYFPYDIATAYIQNNIVCMLVVDENDIILDKIMASDLVKSTTAPVKAAKEFTYVIPQGATKVYVNNYQPQGSNRPHYYPSIIGSYNYEDERLNNSYSVKTEINYSSTENLLYSGLTWGVAVGTYRTNFYDVKVGEKVNVATSLQASTQFNAGIYVDSNNNPIGYIDEWSSSSITPVDVDSIVPAGASKLLVCTTADIEITVSKYDLNVISEHKKLNVTYSDDTLTITNNDNDNYIQFTHYGGNNLFMIKKYKVGSTTNTLSTDMIPAPYIVNAVENPTGDRVTEGFTGGNHQWNNQGSGSTPTAEETGLYIYADDTNITSGASNVQCNNVKIVETNLVQANNTCLEAGGGRNVLSEKIIFNFDGTNLDVINYISPLESIVISRYYGIQTATFNNSDYKVLGDKVYTTSSLGQLTNKPFNIIGGGVVGAIMYDDGLGNYQYNTSSNKCFISNNKSYYVPIYNNTNTFTSANTYYIKGRYIFDTNQF